MGKLGHDDCLFALSASFAGTARGAFNIAVDHGGPRGPPACFLGGTFGCMSYVRLARAREDSSGRGTFTWDNRHCRRPHGSAMYMELYEC